MTKEEFIKAVTDGLVEPPQNFPMNVLMNLQGGMASIDDIITKGKHPLTAKEFQTAWESMEALVLDTRSKDSFANEHIPGSISIGIDDNFPLIDLLAVPEMGPTHYLASALLPA